MEKLDYSRPYGIVYGNVRVDEIPIVHEQDGIHFGPNGEVVEKWSSPEKIAHERTQAQKRRAKEEALAAKREEREKLRKIREEL